MAKEKETKEEKEQLSFEDSLIQLEEIVKKLEVGDVPLDNAINEFNKAITLARNCDLKLKNAEEAITKLVNENGDLQDFNIED